METEPFHEGELQVQERMGVRESIAPWARRVIRDHLPEEHRSFYAGLPFLVAAARDAGGRPWVTLLAREPGFAHSPSPTRLAIGARPSEGDALAEAFGAGAQVGLLGIELATRRRNRVNGHVAVVDAEGFELAVDQSFGNCPQHIREREWIAAVPAPKATRHTRLDAALRAWIEGADTFFIASGHETGLDASHRGGPPGFLEVVGERELVFHDYAGNDHYNTIGNLVLDPRAGITLVDFERGSLLQLTGRTRIEWEPKRRVHFELEEAVELRQVLPLRWSEARGSVRSLRLVEKVPESADVTSFYFESRDGGELPGFEAGQHLPVELRIPGQDGPVSRTWSLSGPPGRYRISVKRHEQGLASRFLHDQLEPGAIVDVRGPAGDFVLEEGDAPVVLVSAGIGVTPLLSMLHALAGSERPVHFVHGARDAAHHPFQEEVAEAARRAGARVHVAYSRPAPGDPPPDSTGRVDGALLAELVPELSAADFYLCGPSAFMAQVQGELEERGVAPRRIRTESF